MKRKHVYFLVLNKSLFEKLISCMHVLSPYVFIVATKLMLSIAIFTFDYDFSR